jgi:PAS domain S-box-containing protein
MPDIGAYTRGDSTSGVMRRARMDNARLAILGVVEIAALWGMVLGLTRLQRHQQAAAALVTHTLEVLGAVSSLDARLQTAIGSERGYVISRDPADRAASEAAAQRTRESLAELHRLIADNPVQQDALARLDTMVEVRLDNLRRTADMVIVLGPRVVPDPELLVASRKASIDVARGLEAIGGEEQLRLMQRQAELERIDRRLWGQVVMCGVTVTGGVAFMFAIVGGWRREQHRILAVSQQNADLEATVAERTQLLAISEAKLRAYFEHSATGIIVLRRSAEGGVTVDTVNPAYAAMTGHSQVMVAGQSIEDIWPQEHAVSIRERVNDALEAGVSKAFTVQRFLRGEVRWLDGIMTPVRSGDDGEAFDLVVASVRDVTHERALTDQIVAQAQAAAEAAEREASVFQHAPGVMTVVSVRERDGEMHYAYEAISPSFEAVIGWKAADLIGKSADDLDAAGSRSADPGILPAERRNRRARGMERQFRYCTRAFQWGGHHHTGA